MDDREFDIAMQKMHDRLRAMHSFPKVCKPEWEDYSESDFSEDFEDTKWIVLKNHGVLVGEITEREVDSKKSYRWHCHTSDWRQEEETLEEAKQNLFMDYVKNWYAYRYGEIGGTKILGPRLGQERPA